MIIIYYNELSVYNVELKIKKHFRIVVGGGRSNNKTDERISTIWIIIKV